jgi:hypothetical protein
MTCTFFSENILLAGFILSLRFVDFFKSQHKIFVANFLKMKNIISAMNL